jgi:Ca2+/Na+ antiporter
MDTEERPAASTVSARRSFLVLYAVCVVLLVSIFLLDLSIAPGVAVGVLYVVVVLLSLWTPHNKVTLIFSLTASFLIIAALFYKPEAVEMWKVVFNRAISLFAVWVTAILGIARKKIEQQRNMIYGEREKAIQEVRVLRGFLPICSSCKKIRDDRGYWTQIEGYIKEHSEAEFTHSICPECAEKLYPDFYKKMDFRKKRQ